MLPRKQARLALLKEKLSVILDAKAKREAEEKLDQQQALLAAIKKRETAMSTRLNSLKTSQNKLESSVTKLQAVISGDDKKKVSTKAAPGATKASGKDERRNVGAAAGATKASKKAEARFSQVGIDADSQAEIGGEMETESEAELDQEVDAEAEIQMAAEEAARMGQF